jgi:hypothetical protein
MDQQQHQRSSAARALPWMDRLTAHGGATRPADSRETGGAFRPTPPGQGGPP